ncbi:MAG: hypothetical protein ABIE23_05025 [archaeon]|nr:hypothetical protein [Candidatus Micrarchaeota archaeon]
MNELVFDASSIISVSENCLMKVLKKLSFKAKSSFIIPEMVEVEVVERPLSIKRFELNALRVKKAIEEGWLEVYRDTEELKRMSERIESITNNIFFKEGKPIHLIHAGEACSLALYKLLSASVLVIDERTTRDLLEKPERFRKRLERNYGKKVSFDSKKFSELNNLLGKIRIVRSSELMAEAFEHGLFKDELKEDSKTLEAVLFALKFNGCAISFSEINSYLKEG